MRTAITRRHSMLQTAALCANAGLALSACGGGGSTGSSQPTAAFDGTRESRVVFSPQNNTYYSINIYLPPASAGPRNGLPVIYMLDGQSWFDSTVSLMAAARTAAILVGINDGGQRNRDFVPSNSCTGSGGGNQLFFEFLRNTLAPDIERNAGGDSGKRTLFGHSHGGSFVLYALFAQAAGQHFFKSYAASDSSIGCMPFAVEQWEANYAATHRALPARLYLSWATAGNALANADFAAKITGRNYSGLTYVPQSYGGTHGGIVPAVLQDVLRFASAA